MPTGLLPFSPARVTDSAAAPLPGVPEPPAGVRGAWHVVPARQDPHVAAPAGVTPVPLRCWLSLPADHPPRAGVLVLPEVFGINAWVRSVADRLAADGYAALALPLFARTAPDLELGYDEASLALGRSHKDRTEADALRWDLTQAADWLSAQLPDPAAPLGCVGFCFGGHVAMLAATLPRIAATCDFYGAGVASGRPGGGPPTLEELPRISGRLLCFCGEADPLIPAADVEAIAAAMAAAPDAARHRLIRVPEAGHGYLCEARADYRPEAAAQGWQAMLDFFGEVLGR